MKLGNMVHLDSRNHFNTIPFTANYYNIVILLTTVFVSSLHLDAHDPEEEEFDEEEKPQEEEDMDIDDEEDKNEPELMFPYEEADPLNPPPPASDSEPEDVTE
ncbi:hypothetical protein Tco_0919745, partial [Tanacetum coccineum]